ncbi:MAG: hypothetical protein GJV46_08540 [Geobacter sp.]|nr:hypothetical protein [Geobacter sp.]
MFIALGLAISMPVRSFAAELQLVSQTIMRGFERQVENGNKLTAVPLYEYIQLDYGNLKSPGLSLHANGWGRGNLADNYNSDGTAGELLHAYLQYVPANRDYLLRAGRQYVFEGVAKDSIDGVYGKAYLTQSITLSAYGGSPVALDTANGRQGDFIFGGKLSYSKPGLFDAGISHKFISDNGSRHEESLGSDLTLLLPGNVTLLGHSALNLMTSGWKEHSYELRLPWRQAVFQPFIQHFNYEDYFGKRANVANPFRFLQGTGNSLTVAGAETFWYPSEHEEYVFKFKNYDYAQRFGNSQLYTLLAVWKHKIFSELGAEVGRMQGSSSENRYYQGRGYFFWNISPGFVTGDVMYVKYDEAIYKKNSSLFTSVGGGFRFLNDAFSVKLSFDYSSDPYFEEDYRWMLKLSYLADKVFNDSPRKN